MKKLIVLLAILPALHFAQSLNVIGFHLSKIPEVMKEKQFSEEQKSKLDNGDLSLWYAHNKMPIHLLLFFDRKYDMCYGETICISKKDKPFFDATVNWANENLEKTKTGWVEKRGEETFDWFTKETEDAYTLAIKQRN